MGQAVLEYLWSFSDKYFFWVGLAMLIGDLSERLSPSFKKCVEKYVPYWTFSAIAALCLFLASFQVWHEEHEKVMGQLTYMDFQQRNFPPFPLLPLFSEGKSPMVALNVLNVGSYLAQDEFHSFKIELEHLPKDVTFDPDTRISQSTPEMESNAFDAFKKEIQGIPRFKDTVTPTGNNPPSYTTANLSRTLSNDEVKELTKGTTLAYVVGFTEWNDGSGHHERRYCWFVRPPATMMLLMQSCNTHHDFLAVAQD